MSMGIDVTDAILLAGAFLPEALEKCIPADVCYCETWSAKEYAVIDKRLVVGSIVA
jgi:hypothetical protein